MWGLIKLLWYGPVVFLLCSVLFNRAASGKDKDCRLEKASCLCITGTAYFLSDKQKPKMNNRMYVNGNSSMSSFSLQSVIIGTPSSASPRPTTRKSSVTIRRRWPGSWPCVALASSTWRGRQQSKAKWPNWLRGLAISGWHSTGKTLWRPSFSLQSSSAKPLFNNRTPH